MTSQSPLQGAPLKGVRVADFGHVLAGPYCSMLLGALGAEVIKIETRARPDEQRAQHGDGIAKDLEGNSNFLEVNLNKLSCSLNLATEKGRDIARRIVAISDVVVENMRPGVMQKLGLGYEELSKVRPDVIMLSLSGFGQTGPLRSYTAYNPCFTSYGGLAHLAGYAEKKPNTLTSSGGDARSGTAGVFAILMALNLRQRTGQGQYIDQSSCEVINSMIGEQMMGYAMNRRSPKRSGNEDAIMAPHNCYRCAGPDEWISVAVGTDAEWAGLRAAMGDPDWARNEACSSAFGRWRAREEIDRHIGEWALGFGHVELMHLLQSHGVAATPSFKAEELFSDPHLTARGAIAEVDHPTLGRRKTIAPPWRFSETPARITKTAPLLGEDTGHVLCDLLGMSRGEVEALMAEKVVY